MKDYHRAGGRSLLRTSFDKKIANDSQMQTFFSGYDDLWRLTKLISIKMTLEDRDKLKSKLSSFYGPSFKKNADSYIYNESTNGLLFSAVSELIMYIEDFLVLITYIREDEEFIKKAVIYWANKIGKVPKRISELNDNELITALMIPNRVYVEEVISNQSLQEKADALKIYDQGVRNLMEYIPTVINAFNKYRLFYNQYKHGLTVALRPYGGELSKGELIRRKNSLDSTLICYDNESIEKSIPKHANTVLIIPNFTPELQPGITMLNQNNNLLRYHIEGNVNIDELIDIGKRVHLLIRTLIKNRFDYIEPNQNKANTFYLPIPKRKDIFRFAQITVVPFEKTLTLNDFRIEI